MESYPDSGCIFVGIWDEADDKALGISYSDLPDDGFIIRKYENSGKNVLAVVGKNEQGALYGVFHLLRSMCLGKTLAQVQGIDGPGNPLRIINHWDNMSGFIERGYAGQSIFFQGQQDYQRFEQDQGLCAASCIQVCKRSYHQQRQCPPGRDTPYN